MDGLLTCAKAFEDLLPVKYHIIIGRKGKSMDLAVSFEAIEFHHLMGLHRLQGLRLSKASHEKVFSQILSGQTTLDDIKKSRYFGNIQNRPEPFQKIEALFDKNALVFCYNRKIQALSLIEAECLLSTPHEYTDVYIFPDKKTSFSMQKPVRTFSFLLTIHVTSPLTGIFLPGIHFLSVKIP